MAVRNGLLARALLTSVSWSRSHLLRKGAARAMTALGYRFRKDKGRFPRIGYAYRSLSTQRSVFRQYGPSRAAYPGYSNHGWGLAVDWSGLGGFHSADYKWLRRHGVHYGWWQPPLFRANGGKPEYWHFEYRSRYDRSKAVIRFQLLLRRWGFYSGKADRIWGKRTHRGAIVALGRIRSGKAKRASVKRLQRVLRAARTYSGRIDGKWGPLSERGWDTFRYRYYVGA